MQPAANNRLHLHLHVHAQIVWRLQPSADMRTAPTLWSRYVWRRGSVPLWWAVKIRNNGMGEAEIKISQTCTFRGSRRYEIVCSATRGQCGGRVCLARAWACTGGEGNE